MKDQVDALDRARPPGDVRQQHADVDRRSPIASRARCAATSSCSTSRPSASTSAPPPSGCATPASRCSRSTRRTASASGATTSGRAICASRRCARSSAGRRPSRSPRPRRRTCARDIVAQLKLEIADDDHHRVRSHEPVVPRRADARPTREKDDALVASAADDTTASRSSTRRRAKPSRRIARMLERARIPRRGVSRRPRRRRIATTCRTRS